MDAKMICGDYLMFQDHLKKMRSVDDHIVNSLNNSLPTVSFTSTQSATNDCKGLYQTLLDAHLQRSEAIKGCILLTAGNLKELKHQRESNRDDAALEKSFKLEQRKLRMLQSEMNVEDIIKERTFKTFKERCGMFFNFQTL